ncbi:hypothetical protein BH20PSE1_BH20PSE1_22880 [soil metagenome]
MTDYPTRIDGLEINPVEDGFVIYKPERDRVHYLNHTAVLVLEFCNGRNSAADIVDLMKKAYSLAETPEAEIREILAKMEDEGLIQ